MLLFIFLLLISCIYCALNNNEGSVIISQLGLSDSETRKLVEFLYSYNFYKEKDHSLKILKCLKEKLSDHSTKFKIKLIECDNSIIMQHLDHINLILDVANINLKNKYETLYTRFKTELKLQRNLFDVNFYLKK